MDSNCTQTSSTVGPLSIASPSAKEAVLVANSPSFLLDRLRKDVAVQNVLATMKTAEIVQSLRTRLDSSSTDPVTLVALYVLLVALSATDPSDREAWKQIESLDLSQLEWGNILRRLIWADAVPMTTMDVTLPSSVKP